MFENFERTMRKATSNFNTIMLSVTLSATIGATAAYNIVFEEWDNAPTDQTEQVTQGITDMIKEISTLNDEKAITQKRQDIFEYDNADKDLEPRSAEWIEYKAQEEALADNLTSLTEKTKRTKKHVFNTLMTSPDIPENQWQTLSDAFKKVGGNTLIDTSSAYILKECQTEVAQNNTPGHKAENIAQCMAGEKLKDVTNTAITGGIGSGFASLLSLIVLSSFAPNIQSAARNRKQRKEQKNKIN